MQVTIAACEYMYIISDQIEYFLLYVIKCMKLLSRNLTVNFWTPAVKYNFGILPEHSQLSTKRGQHH